jgi:hypothetical protein
VCRSGQVCADGSFNPSTTASGGASGQLPAGTIRQPAAAYSSAGKARCGAASTVIAMPLPTSAAASPGTTGARSSTAEAS